MEGRAVPLPGRHVRAQPLLRAADRLRIGRWGRGIIDAKLSGDRIGRSQEPSLVLALCEDDADVPVLTGRVRPLQYLRRQLCRAVVAIAGTIQEAGPNSSICFGVTFASFASGASCPILSSSPAV